MMALIEAMVNQYWSNIDIYQYRLKMILNQTNIEEFRNT